LDIGFLDRDFGLLDSGLQEVGLVDFRLSVELPNPKFLNRALL
jgi:hypothetical protein